MELWQVVRVRLQEMRDSATLGVDEDEGSERDEVEQVASPAAERESRHQQNEQVAIGRERETDEQHCDRERESQNRPDQQRVAGIERLPRWAPPLAVGVAALLALAARIPFWRAPLTADEGGYTEVARLWERGAHLYQGAWVDRPQGLILVFRALLDAGGGSAESIRLLAALVAMAVVLATMALATRLCGRIEGAAAGLLLATFGASPFIESFTLAGELLASLPAVLSLLAFVAYLRRRQLPWLVLPGLLAAAGWCRSPLLARLWLGAALLGVLGGGNFHPHYYLQLAPPLSLLAGIGIGRLIVRPQRALAAACCAAAAAAVGLTVPLWFARGTAQARTIWSHDPHLVDDGELAAYVRAHTEPGQRILVIWAAADIYELADRPPAEPFLWIRNLQALPQARAAARRALVERKPALVLDVQRPEAVDSSGATSRILRRDYRRVTQIDGTPIL